MTTQTEQSSTEDTNQNWTDAIEQGDNLENETVVVAEQEVPEGAPAPEVAPEVAPATTAPTTSAPDPVSEREKVVARREEELAETEYQQNLRRTAIEYGQQQYTKHINAGMEEATAQQLAISEATSQVANEEKRRVTQKLVALEENVPINILNGAQDEPTMRQRAQQHKQMAGPQREELDAVKKELAQFKAEMRKAQVPAQSYNQASGASGSSSDNDTWIKYGRGELDWSPQVQKAGRALGHL